MRESDLLEHIYAANPDLPARISLPPGDDMGAVRLGNPTHPLGVLVTVDQVADGVHFCLDVPPPPGNAVLAADLASVARKAVTRNLSDVAAMAARPVGCVAAAALPRSFTRQRADALFDHLRRVAAEYDCPLFGGDVTIWDHPLILSVTVLAEAWHDCQPVPRRGAAIGDAVFVTGRLGGSLLPEPSGDPRPIVPNLHFEPRIPQAHALARDPMTRPSAMIDLSDGLGRDLARLCAFDGLAARIDADALPLRPSIAAVPDAWRRAMGDGEDYELCFTVPPPRADHLPSAVEGVPITRIGTIVESGGSSGSIVRVRLPDGSLASGDQLGWEHRA